MKLSLKTKTFDFFRQIFKISFLERFLVKITTNKPFSSIVVKFIPNNYQYKSNSIRIVNRKGINYKLNIFDYVDWWIYFGLIDDSRERLYELAGDGNTIIDVGANMGETIMNFSNIVGTKGEVYGFEPDRINHERCTDNLKLNNFKNIILNNVGLGDVPGQFKIRVDTPSNRGGNRISNSTDDTNTEIINVITLDDYVNNNKLHRVNLIKIDVEGFELNVLKGAIKTLNQYKPILFIELDDTNLNQQNHTAQELVSFLMNIGYKIVNAETNESITEESDFKNCHYDIICRIS